MTGQDYLAEVQAAIHRIHYPHGDPATDGNVWCACDKLWPCETVTATAKAVLGSPVAIGPAGVDWAVRVTLHDGSTSVRHEDDPFAHRSVAEQFAENARRHRTVASAEVVCRNVWHGPWTGLPTAAEEPKP